MSSNTSSKSLSFFFESSIGKKVLMALTGLFLVTFLIINVSINAMVFFRDGGATFSHCGHFMGTNPIIRFLEIGLVAGFLVHIIDGLLLWKANHNARPVKYAYNQPNANSKWYSRSMGVLGSLLLLFLILHTSHFWIPNRVSQGLTNWESGEIDLYAKMIFLFHDNPYSIVAVSIYVLGCVALFWHLLHGFKSAFQTLGLNHVKYNGIIAFIGTAFAIVVPAIFALIPIAIYFGCVK